MARWEDTVKGTTNFFAGIPRVDIDVVHVGDAGDVMPFARYLIAMMWC